MVARAVNDIQAEIFAAFLREFIGIFGITNLILSDNAPKFCNNLVSDIATAFKFELWRSTPHHHQGNAMVERAIQTLQDKLALITHDLASSTNWEEQLPSAVLSINTSENAATSFTPFELMYGRKHQVRSELV